MEQSHTALGVEGYSGNGGGAGDFGEHYSAHEQRYMAGLFILKNGKLTEHGSQDHDFSNHGADVSELLNSACVGMMNEADIMTGISLGKVNESMIRVASTYFPKLLTRVLETYARQLLTQEEKLRAMNYFLLINQPEQAIRALTLQKEYYRQAIVLSKIFTPKKVDELSKDAAAHFLKICSYQIAHELYCSNGNYAEALASLETLNTAQATIASEFVAKKLKCDETESEVLGNRLGELTLDNAEKEPVFAA